MQISNGIFRNYGDFELDINAVGMRSVSLNDIRLPYSGELPAQMRPVQSAYVYLNVQLVQGVRLVLLTDNGAGKCSRRPLDASNEEIISLLDRFFTQDAGSTGLEDYWLGVWQAYYIEWRKIVTSPSRLLDVISNLSDRDKQFLQQHMMDRNAVS